MASLKTIRDKLEIKYNCQASSHHDKNISEYCSFAGDKGQCPIKKLIDLNQKLENFYTKLLERKKYE